jgi:hypothetical protein
MEPSDNDWRGLREGGRGPLLMRRNASYPAPQNVVISQRCSGGKGRPLPLGGRGYAGSWIWTSEKTPSRHLGE